jgi:hypothetical protein
MVVVKAGVYYERRIQINRTDTSSLAITFKAEPGAIIDHGLQVRTWVSDGSSVFKGLPDFSSATDQNQGIDNVKKWTNMVVVAGKPLKRVYKRSDMTEGTFYLNSADGMVYVWAFGGVNPATQTTLVLNAKDAPEYYYPGIQLSKTTKHIIFDGFTHRAAGTAIEAGEYGSTTIGEDLVIKNCKVAFNWQYAIRFNSWKGATIDTCNIQQSGLVNWPRGRFARDENDSVIYDASGVPQRVGWPHAIIGWNGDTITVRNSQIHDNHGEGVGPYFDSSEWKIVRNTIFDNYSVNVYVDTSDGDVIVDRNLIYNTPSKYQGSKSDPAIALRANPDGIRIANEKADLDTESPDPTPGVANITVTNNIILSTGGGITSFRYSGGHYYLKNSVIANNTVVTSATSSYGDAALVVDYGENVTVANNIITPNSLFLDHGQGSGIKALNNLLKETSKLVVGTGVNASGTLFSAPNFVNGTGLKAENYKLKSNSPARDRGVVVTVPEDYFGTTRSQGSAYDIGAHEYTPPAK